MSGAAGDERSRLLRALRLSRRFHLYLARCKSPRASDQLVKALDEELPRLRKAKVVLVRLDPYAGQAARARLTDGELADRVLLPLLSPPDDLRAHGTIHIVDASRAGTADVDAWARFFALWNEKRNTLQAHGGEVLVMLPEVLAAVFATSAPDVWSIRSGEYEIGEQVQAPVHPGLEAIASAKASPHADVKRLLRGIPLLALFGGDLVIRPWVEDILEASMTRGLREERRGLEGAELHVIAQRNRRVAEMALAERRFGEAEASFRDLLQLVEGAQLEGAREVEALALSGLCIALAAQDRAGEALDLGERALSLVEPGGRAYAMLGDRVVNANALVCWCAGHLKRADEMAELATRSGSSLDASRSRAIRWVELGRVRLVVEQASSGRDDSMEIADVQFLIGDVQGAHRDLVHISPERVPVSREDYFFLLRYDALLALIELARGDDAGAELLLYPYHRGRPEELAALRTAMHSPMRCEEPEPETERESDDASRAKAMRELAWAIWTAKRDNPEGARVHLHRARESIDTWGRYGLDRRSRLRARVTVDLGLTMLEPSPEQGLAGAYKLAEKAMALLGDTAEDSTSRVLAVKAFAELARRLPAGEDKEAASRRALELAQPLAGLGVPAWDELGNPAA